MLKAAFNNSAIPQLIIDPTGTILDANRQACQTLQQSHDDLIKLNHRSLVDEDPDLISGLASKFKRDNILNWTTEQKYNVDDGSIFWARVSVTSIHEDGRISKLLLQLQDITGLKQSEGDIQRNNDELEQFVYIASHDLREPLTSIAGFASLLKKRHKDSIGVEGHHFLTEILDATKRMECKIDDLLSFSRAGRVGVIDGIFSLGSAVEEARRNLAIRIEATSTMLDIQGTLPTVQGDRSLIAQVFQNLFSNSIKYKGADPPHIIIKAEPCDDENCWVITVRDNGLGFDMHHRDRIFGVFQRLYTIEEYPGTGIGLAIAKKIVERHHGRIWPTSEPGQGSTFFFTIPRTEVGRDEK